MRRAFLKPLSPQIYQEDLWCYCLRVMVIDTKLLFVNTTGRDISHIIALCDEVHAHPVH